MCHSSKWNDNPQATNSYASMALKLSGRSLSRCHPSRNNIGAIGIEALCRALFLGFSLCGKTIRNWLRNFQMLIFFSPEFAGKKGEQIPTFNLDICFTGDETRTLLTEDRKPKFAKHRSAPQRLRWHRRSIGRSSKVEWRWRFFACKHHYRSHVEEF